MTIGGPLIEKLCCPECGAQKSSVIDGRPGPNRKLIGFRRRRKCPNGHKYTTYEISKNDFEALNKMIDNCVAMRIMNEDIATTIDHIEKCFNSEGKG